MTAKRKPVAYSYQRYSDPSQRKGASLDRQDDGAVAWCRRNGITLDTSLVMVDDGVPSLHGQNQKKGFALFLAAIESGRVRSGDYLIVESIDRLTRQQPVDALHFVFGLLVAGVKIVQLLPREEVYDRSTGIPGVIGLTVEVGRGNSESATKSARVSDAWSRKRTRAVESRRIATRMVPAWLTVEDGRFQVRPGAAETIRRVYRMVRDGYGVESVAKTFNREGVPHFAQRKGQGQHWTTRYVARLIDSRQVIGEWQPCSGGRPVGEPIPDYFPRIVTADEWYSTQAVYKARRPTAGRRSRRLNIFRGLLWDARTRSRMQVDSRGSRPATIYPGAFAKGKASYISFPYSVFETCVLHGLREVDPAELVEPSGESDRMLALAARVEELAGKIERQKRRLIDCSEEEERDVQDLISRLSAERRKLVDEMTELRQKAANPLSETWGQAKGLLEVIAEHPEPAEIKLKLAGLLKRMVSDIWVLVCRPGGRRSVCFVQVHYAGRGVNRTYLIAHERAVSGARSIPSKTTIMTAPLPNGEDLRSAGPELVEFLEGIVSGKIDPSTHMPPRRTVAQ